MPDSVRELERVVELDVTLHREFHDGAVRVPSSSMAHPSVLVVDAAPDALTVLSIYLSRTGYNVVTATSAEDCLAKLRHHAIDAIVLDARLPGASGEHVCRVLRTDPAYAHRRHVPVIVYTGYSEEFPPEVRERWQADDYVGKGGDMLPLMRALVRHTSAAVTSPVLIRKFACFSLTCAPPRRAPRMPAASTSRHAESLSPPAAVGFLKVDRQSSPGSAGCLRASP